jgi:hypothetical protein
VLAPPVDVAILLSDLGLHATIQQDAAIRKEKMYFFMLFYFDFINDLINSARLIRNRIRNIKAKLIYREGIVNEKYIILLINLK